MSCLCFNCCCCNASSDAGGSLSASVIVARVFFGVNFCLDGHFVCMVVLSVRPSGQDRQGCLLLLRLMAAFSL